MVNVGGCAAGDIHIARVLGMLNIAAEINGRSRKASETLRKSFVIMILPEMSSLT
jgi:hypothetical protein